MAAKFAPCFQDQERRAEMALMQEQDWELDQLEHERREGENCEDEAIQANRTLDDQEVRCVLLYIWFRCGRHGYRIVF
jgi:hypothetical protein